MISATPMSPIEMTSFLGIDDEKERTRQTKHVAPALFELTAALLRRALAPEQRLVTQGSIAFFIAYLPAAAWAPPASDGAG